MINLNKIVRIKFTSMQIRLNEYIQKQVQLSLIFDIKINDITLGDICTWSNIVFVWLKYFL